MGLVSLPAVPGLQLAHRGSILVCSFSGWPTGPSLRALAATQAELSRQLGRLTVLAVIPDLAAADVSGPHPCDAERDAMLRTSAVVGEELEEATLASGLVILPRGLVAAMIRSFVGAMALLSRSRLPLKTFRTLRPAIEWLGMQPGAPSIAGLEREVEQWLGIAAAQQRAASN